MATPTDRRLAVGGRVEQSRAVLVFISWSGARSKAVAEALAAFLPQVIQAVEPWLSQEIAKGTRWEEQVGSNLEKTGVGISVVTPENLHSDWILFEAGAMSKSRAAHVCTFLIGLRPAEVEPPLGQFHHTLPDREDVKRLVKTINGAVAAAKENALTESRLDKAFGTHWPELASALEAASASAPSEDGARRDPVQMMEETLELVRDLWRRMSPPLATLQTKNLDALVALAAPLAEDRPQFYRRAMDLILSGSHAAGGNVWSAVVASADAAHQPGLAAVMEDEPDPPKGTEPKKG